MIDVAHEINAVQRQVGTRVLEAGEARTVTVSRTYDAPVDDVWDAITDPERLPRWFLPVSGELRVGGRYELKGNASGTIESCDPPQSLTATWEFGGEVSWIELRLIAEHENRTRFVLEHIAHVDDERWAQFGPGAVGVGWDLALRASRFTWHPASASTRARRWPGARQRKASSSSPPAAKPGAAPASPPALTEPPLKRRRTGRPRSTRPWRSRQPPSGPRSGPFRAYIGIGNRCSSPSPSIGRASLYFRKKRAPAFADASTDDQVALSFVAPEI
jgi:uncharacterized protein YndB with AHSA1/START domain